MDLSRQEYPALLVGQRLLPPALPAHTDQPPLPQSSLQPSQAVALVNERVEYISKLNYSIADWLEVLLCKTADDAMYLTIRRNAEE